MFKENYNIDFEEAKNMSCYKFTLKDEITLKTYQKLFNEIAENDDNYYGGKEVLEFGSVDIELNVTTRSSERKENILDFYICEKTKTHGWCSHDFSNYVIKEEDLSSVESLERVMFEQLMIYAKNNSLYWSKLN